MSSQDTVNKGRFSGTVRSQKTKDFYGRMSKDSGSGLHLFRDVSGTAAGHRVEVHALCAVLVGSLRRRLYFDSTAADGCFDVSAAKSDTQAGHVFDSGHDNKVHADDGGDFLS